MIRSINSVKEGIAKDVNLGYDFLMDLSDDRLCAATSKTAKQALWDCVQDKTKLATKVLRAIDVVYSKIESSKSKDQLNKDRGWHDDGVEHVD